MTMTRDGKRIVIPILAAVALVIVILAFVGRPGSQSGEGEGATEQAAEQVATMWICPMHPQIRQPEPGDCPLCGMDLVPVVEEAEDDEGERRLTVSEAGRKLMEIRTSPVERRHVPAEIDLVGKVAYSESRVSQITAWVPGRLDRLHIDYTGYVVKKGDPMVDLYAPELLAAQEELVQSSQAARRARSGASVAAREMAEVTLEAVRERLRLWGLTDPQIREIEERGAPEPHVTILAPTGGTVIEKNATEGMYVGTGTVIYTIADLSTVWVELDAYETDLSRIRTGQDVEIGVEAFPGERFSGAISFIEPTVDPTTRTVKVRVEVENPRGRLKPDMFVRAVVLAGHPAGHAAAPLVIPATAPLITGRRAVVYVEIEGADRPTFEGREVVLGARVGDYYEVREGLTEGERVVTEGSFKIDSALQIRAKPSMMSPEGAEAPAAGGHGGHTH